MNVTKYIAEKVAEKMVQPMTDKIKSLEKNCIDIAEKAINEATPELVKEWFSLYNKDVYDGHDYVIVNGHKCKPPRYFDKLLSRTNPDRFDQVKASRESRGFSQYKENFPVRLDAKETVARAGLNRLKPRGDL